MLIFAIDTCCMSSTAAVLDGERMLVQSVINHKRTHSQILMPQVETILDLAELSISDIDYFAAAVGPGSFTGVRIGVATVKALAQAGKKPCVAVSTLHALANNVGAFHGIICPILDARREQVYNGLFSGGKVLERLCPDRAIALSDLLSELQEMGKPVLFLGDGTLVYREEIQKELGETAQFAPPHLNMNLAGSVAELAQTLILEGKTVSYDALKPEYVRLSQAEQEQQNRQKKENFSL